MEYKLTTYEEILSSYRTSIVETSSGKVFEIQGVSPGELMLAAGSPLIARLTEAGVDIGNEESVSDVVNKMSESEQIKLASEPAFLSTVRNIVCKGVASINLVDKPASVCNSTTKEVSLEFLSLNEMFELFTAILTVSATDEEVKDFYSFREGSAYLQDSSGEDTSDS